MTRLTAALLLGLAALPTHAATSALYCGTPGDPLADINNVVKVDFVMNEGVVYRAPTP